MLQPAIAVESGTHVHDRPRAPEAPEAGAASDSGLAHPTSGVPSRAPDDASPWCGITEDGVGTLTVSTRIGVDADGSLVIRRELVGGEGDVHGVVVALTIASADQGQAEWLMKAVASISPCPRLIGKMVTTMGAERAARTIIARAHALLAEREEEARAAELVARDLAELEREVSMGCAGGKAAPRIELHRGASADPVWSIRFDETWERDRLWDWLQWQDERFTEFAGYVDANGATGLRSRLLREMVETERLVRSNGLATAGRRPLRFWCGETA